MEDFPAVCCLLGDVVLKHCWWLMPDGLQARMRAKWPRLPHTQPLGPRERGLLWGVREQRRAEGVFLKCSLIVAFRRVFFTVRVICGSSY